MSHVSVFPSILISYDPKDPRSHGVLKFFSEDLNEDEIIEFVSLLFESGSWVLPTEISNSSDSVQLREITKNKFHTIFNQWVSLRIEHSLSISNNIKDLNIQFQYIIEFRDALFSIRNLGFPIVLMSELERFLIYTNTAYFKKFLKGTLNYIIEEFNVEEIELFLNFFAKLYHVNASINLSNFLYYFLNDLAYSYKIFDLSSDFIAQLSALSKILEERYRDNKYFNVISILLIDLIEKKNINLSNSRFGSLIELSIDDLEKGNIDDLDFFIFLKHFKYQFPKFDFKTEINALFHKCEITISSLSNSDERQKKEILHHFVMLSHQYLELFLFYLENISQEFVKELIIKFILFVDKLRASFSSILWFDEYLNFTPLNGKISGLVPNGFNVELDQNYFIDRIGGKQMTNEFVEQNGFGFLNVVSLRDFPKTSISYSASLGKNLSKADKQLIVSNAKNNGYELFLISKVNYSSSNKRNVLTLIPFNKSLSNKISRFGLKALFSSLELFLIDKSCEFLKIESSFQRNTHLAKKIFSSEFKDEYNIKLKKEVLWDILEDVRPIIFQAVYLNNNNTRATFNDESYKELIALFENKTIVNGVIISRAKGGMIVEVLGQKAFLPGSQIDVKPVTDYDYYVGKALEFKIVKIDYEKKNAVVSHKAVIEAEYELQKSDALSKLEKGLVLEGVVKNIISYGVFIDLGGVDGLIHISDLTWGRISHPSEVVKMGQKINVVILDFDNEKKRIELGLKQLSAHPWDGLKADLAIGDKVKGKVVVIADYGAFVEISQGVEGLIHVSEMSWSQHLRNAHDFLKVGEEVEAVVLTLDREERKMSLGIKQLMPDPWSNVITKYSKGTKHSETVRYFTNYGVFVELEEGVEGMIHISDLSWAKKFKHPNEFTKIGDKIDFLVLEIDSKNRRLSLGHKQLEKNPWDVFETIFVENSLHQGAIISVMEKGAIVSLPYGAEGFCPTRHLVKNDGSSPKVGEVLEFNIIEFKKKNKKIIISLKQ